jgi:hypothetical protein
MGSLPKEDIDGYTYLVFYYGEQATDTPYFVDPS